MLACGGTATRWNTGRSTRGTCVDDRLISLAALCSRATDRHHWHVAGVEVGAQGRRRRRATLVNLLCRIDLESEVLLDDPLVVGDLTTRYCGRSLQTAGILYLHLQTAAGLEGHTDGRAIADLLLCVDRNIVEGERSGATGVTRQEGAIRLQEKSCSA